MRRLLEASWFAVQLVTFVLFSMMVYAWADGTLARWAYYLR